MFPRIRPGLARQAAAIGTLCMAIPVTACNRSADNKVGSDNPSALENDLLAHQTQAGAITNAEVRTSDSAKDFANSVADMDSFEVGTSRLAARQAGSPAIKDFARQMIDAHLASTARLKAITATLKPPFAPDPSLTDDQQDKLDGLLPLYGTIFDRNYVLQQVVLHEAALSVLQSYSQKGAIPALREFAAGEVKTVSDHLAMARRLKS